MNTRIYTLIILLAASLQFFGQNEFKETVSKHHVFSVIPECQINITNKYGDVILNKWDRDTVVIDIQMVINTEKKEKTEALLELIDFTVVNSEFYIVASTEFGNYSGSFINNFNRMMQTLFTSSNQLNIKYTVYYPANATIKVDNKYGNVVVDDIQKNLHVKLNNGDLRIGNVGGFLELEQDFGNAHIGNIQDANIKYSFGDMEIKKAKHVKIDSRSGRINITELTILEVKSIRDKYYIGKVQQIIGKTSFSYFNIYRFEQSMKVDSHFGEMNINGIDKNFSHIDLKGEYTDVYIHVSSDLAFEIDIEHNNQTEIVTTLDAHLEKEQIGDTKYYQTRGYVGSSSAKNKIIISTSSGKITITQ